MALIHTLFLLFRTDLALKLLFLPILEDLDKFRDSLPEFPLLALILQTLNTDPEKRTYFDIWKSMLNLIGNFEESWLTEKISAEILENLGVDLEPINLAQKSEEGTIYYMLQAFKKNTLQEIGSPQVNENKAWEMSQAGSHFGNISLEMLNKTSNLLSRGLCSRMVNSIFKNW